MNQKYHRDDKVKSSNLAQKLSKFGIEMDIEDGQIAYNGQERLKLKTKSLHLLRHGHTEGTESHTFMSDISNNAHITDRGRDTILKLISSKEKYGFDAVVVCSDIPRVVETADMFRRVNPDLPYDYQTDFKGINNQGWEGMCYETLPAHDKANFVERELKHNVFAKSSEGESWGQVLSNCADLIEYLNSNYAGKNVLLIGQGSIIRGMDILLGTRENPWDGYDTQKLYNFSHQNDQDNYGTISCIQPDLERTIKKSEPERAKIVGDGMIHGRFQPYTIGHMQHTKRALKLVEKGSKLYVGLTKPFVTDNGLSTGDDHRDSKSSNPYTFEQRREMVLQSVMNDPEIADRIDDIIVIPWSMNNMDDLNAIVEHFMPDRNVTQFMNIIPGDGWEEEKRNILQGLGFPVLNIVNPTVPRITSATEVRSGKGKYVGTEKLVPAGTRKILEMLKQDPNAIPKQYDSISEYIDSMQKFSGKSIVSSLLPRTPEEQDVVDQTASNIKNHEKALESRNVEEPND